MIFRKNHGLSPLKASLSYFFIKTNKSFYLDREGSNMFYVDHTTQLSIVEVDRSIKFHRRLGSGANLNLILEIPIGNF